MDILALPLAAALNLRLWCVFFGVRSGRFVAALVVASACEVAARLLDARRRSERPQIFCHERRHDLIAALLVGTGPWPVVPSLNGASSLTHAWRALAVTDWTIALASLLVFAVAVSRLAAVWMQPTSPVRISQSSSRQITIHPPASLLRTSVQ